MMWEERRIGRCAAEGNKSDLWPLNSFMSTKKNGCSQNSNNAIPQELRSKAIFSFGVLLSPVMNMNCACKRGFKYKL